MRLYSFFASQIDFLKNDCVKLLALNANRSLSVEDFIAFRDRIDDMNDLLNDRAVCDYFAEK